MLAYRNAEPEDMRLIEESFLDSFRTAHAAGLIAMEDWRDVMMPQIAKMLSRPGVQIIVAHNPNAINPRANIYGWLAHETGHPQPYVIYCYVKQGYRKEGLARRLFAQAGIDPAQPFQYAAKTSALTHARIRAAIPQAKWKPLTARFTKDTTPETDKDRHVKDKRKADLAQ